jgi:hypothetical protein
MTKKINNDGLNLLIGRTPELGFPPHYSGNPESIYISGVSGVSERETHSGPSKFGPKNNHEINPE